MMDSKPYEYLIDEETIKRFRDFQPTDWNIIIQSVIKFQPLYYNIDFTSDDPYLRICDLYHIIETYNLDKKIFQAALIEILLEYYEKKYFEIITIIIDSIEYIKPSIFLPKLINIITSIGDLESSEKFLVKLKLINAILFFDSNKLLLPYLKGLLISERIPEYYQIIVRYGYINCNQMEFNYLMNSIFEIIISNERVKSLVFNTLDEYVYYNFSFSKIYLWLYEYHNSLKGINNLIPDFISLIEDDYDDRSNFQYCFLLNTLLSLHNAIPEIADETLLKLFTFQPLEVSNIINYIGVNNLHNIIKLENANENTVIINTRSTIFSIEAGDNELDNISILYETINKQYNKINRSEFYIEAV